MNLKKITTTILLLTFLSTVFLSGCTNKAEDTNTSSKPIIAVSIVPQKTFVEAICGDDFQVLTLIPPGQSPENYEPTPKEMEGFQNAVIYFSIGVPTEEANILPTAKSQGIKVVSLADEVSKTYDDITFDEGERDPHIWLSPKRVIEMIKVIETELINLDNKNQEKYHANSENYIKKLNQLDENVKHTFKDVNNNKIIVFHPSFGYLADDYSIEMYALEQHGKEVTPRHLQEMIDLAKKENIKVIFYQQEFDSSQSKAFAEEIGGETMMLNPLAANYIENLQDMADLIAKAAR